MDSSYAEENLPLWENDETKGQFVEVVLILADFFCVANGYESDQQHHICERISKDLCSILKVSIHPFSTFQEFKQRFEVSDHKLRKHIGSKLQQMVAVPHIPILQYLKDKPKFEQICDEINSWKNACQLVESLQFTIER